MTGFFKSIKKNFFFKLTIAAHRLSLVAVSGSCSLVVVCGLLEVASPGGEHRLLSVQASPAACDLWSAGLVVVVHRQVTGFVLFIAETSNQFVVTL